MAQALAGEQWQGWDAWILVGAPPGVTTVIEDETGRRRDVAPRHVSEPAPPRVAAGLPFRVRVWLQEFLTEITKAGATEKEVEDARRLLTAPEVFTFYAGGSPRDFTEDQVLEGMQALAVFIRARLKKLGRKLP